MKRILFTGLMALLVLVIGCESDKTTSPVEPVDHLISLILPEATVVAPAGVEVSLPISAMVVTDDGAPAPKIPVTFQMLAGSGTFNITRSMTDSTGRISGTLQTSVTQGNGKLMILATTSYASARGEISFHGTDSPSAIDIAPPPSNFLAPSDAPVMMPLHAGVVNSSGFGVAGIPLKYSLYNTDNLVTYGRLSGDSMSRADGSVEFAFESVGKYGHQYVIVSTDTSVWKGISISDTIQIEVKRSVIQINSLTVQATPSILDPGPDTMGVSAIRVQVVDVNRVGLPNILVNLSTDLGYLADVTPTDANGTIQATFYNNFEVGMATITASIPGTGFDATCNVRIYQYDDTRGNLALTSDRDFIYADNGRMVAHLTAVLKDGDSAPVAGKLITFHCGQGLVNSPVMTDSNGVARAIFTDQGVPSLDAEGYVIPVVIYAKYRAQNLVDSVEVTIRPQNPIGTITLVTANSELEVSATDSFSVLANCFLQSGAFAPVGTTFLWEASLPSGVYQQWGIVSGFGASVLKLPVGTKSGHVLVTASATAYEEGADTVTSNWCEVSIRPGPVSGCRIEIVPIDPEHAYDYWWVKAILVDAFRNPVRAGEFAFFTTDKGSISPTAVTDSSGVAKALLSRGVESGVAVLTISVRAANGDAISVTRTMTFVAGTPYSIDLTCNPSVLHAVSAHAPLPATVRAVIKDSNGNLVERATTVVFEIITNTPPPQNCNINNRGILDSARTANGVAVVSLNPGLTFGAVRLRAYTWRDPDNSNPGDDHVPRTDTVSAEIANIIVLASEPDSVSIAVDTDGEDIGGGAWELEVSARVWDSNNNPAEDRIPVLFTIEPEIATIDPGFTGNDIGHGVSSGVAYTRLRYNSFNTYDQITIRAEVQTVDGVVSTSRQMVLPLQHGRVQLSTDPGNWMFERDRPNDTCLFRVWALVTDGHGVNINNAPVVFSTDHARYYWRNVRLNGRFIPFAPNPVRRYTGLVDQENNEEQGVGTVYLRGIMNDFFLDDFTLETVTRIEAHVDGVDGVEAEPITVRAMRR